LSKCADLGETFSTWETTTSSNDQRYTKLDDYPVNDPKGKRFWSLMPANTVQTHEISVDCSVAATPLNAMDGQLEVDVKSGGGVQGWVAVLCVLCAIVAVAVGLALRRSVARRAHVQLVEDSP